MIFCAIKRDKHPWWSVTLTNKSNVPPWVFSRFLNCTNGGKSRKVFFHIGLSVILEKQNKSKKCCILPWTFFDRIHNFKFSSEILILWLFSTNCPYTKFRSFKLCQIFQNKWRKPKKLTRTCLSICCNNQVISHEL